MDDLHHEQSASLRECVDPKPATWADRIRAWLPGNLRIGLTIDDALEPLGVSRRCLQRHLADEGTSWTGLLSEVREREAKRLLEDGEMVSAVSRALGYAEHSGFHRAFVRWTGQTPGRWRRINHKPRPYYLGQRAAIEACAAAAGFAASYDRDPQGENIADIDDADHEGPGVTGDAG